MKVITSTDTTLITGFLGAGKTTFINQLIAHFDSRQWALLINEMGQIGIDGALIDSKDGMMMKQINGGCICCSSQLPLQVSLVQLFKHKPARLIIEPTGLAHPKQLLQILNEPHWRSSIHLKSVIGLLNARQWTQDKYKNHEQFLAHVKYSDVIIVNRYEPAQKRAICQWILDVNPDATVLWQPLCKPDESLIGKLSVLIDAPTHHLPTSERVQSLAHTKQTDLTPDKITPPYRHQQYIDNHWVVSWLLPAAWQTKLDVLIDHLLSVDGWQRIKAVVHTEDGWHQLNFTKDSLTTLSTDAHTDNKIQLIVDTAWCDAEEFDKALMALFQQP